MLGDRLMELANLSYTALVVGQMLAQQVNLRAMAFGLVFLIACYTGAMIMARGGEA